uniref:Transposase n=1 Tax=Ditylenchus dipsaci TaxID=166011 RepID=A0A915E8U4_9BILA
MATKKKKPSGSQAEQVKKWAHADEMSFLDNFIRERPEQSSSLSTKSGTQACEIPIDDDETVQIDLSNDTPVRAKKPKISPLEAKLVEIMDKPELKQHPEKFHSYMRMNLSEFNRLLGLVTPWLAWRSIRTPINPEERLMLALRFLATGEAFRSLSFQFRLGVSTVSEIVSSTCRAIFSALKKDYLQVPSTEEEWIDIADKLLSRWDCPNTLGAIDGKHILIKRPYNG